MNGPRDVARQFSLRKRRLTLGIPPRTSNMLDRRNADEALALEDTLSMIERCFLDTTYGLQTDEPDLIYKE